MNRDRMLRASERWFRLLVWLYHVDFRDEMGTAMADTYRDRARHALDSSTTHLAHAAMPSSSTGVWA